MINWIKQFKKNGQRRSAKENYDERFLNLNAEFDKQRKYIAGVCVGALPIGKSGVLAGRNATTYHLGGGNRQRQLAVLGVNVIPDQRIVKDCNIIISFCPETAVDVAFILLSHLVGRELADAVISAMGYDPEKIWNTLYNEARKVLKPRKVSEMLEAPFLICSQMEKMR